MSLEIFDFKINIVLFCFITKQKLIKYIKIFFIKINMRVCEPYAFKRACMVLRVYFYETLNLWHLLEIRYFKFLRKTTFSMQFESLIQTKGKKAQLNQDIFQEHFQKVQIQQLGFGTFTLMHMILIVIQVI
jgi:hypothetical protein